tara:strand:- start:27 stop:719 length:693 start_codon:yes stop_codon:yes gene_type:complete
MATNLHKDLNDLQLHVPKGFAAASNSTTCQKDASGNLVWAAGGGGGVSSIIAGSNVTISPVGGTGNVTINASAGGTQINTTSFRGFFNNKSGTTSNWMGYDIADNLMKVDFGSSGTSAFSNTFAEIIPSTIHVVTSTDPTLINFSGRFICTTAVTVQISIWKVTPTCLGTLTGTLTLISNVLTAVTANDYECFDVTLSNSLLKGDMIVALVKSSANGAVSLTSTIRLEQL